MSRGRYPVTARLRRRRISRTIATVATTSLLAGLVIDAGGVLGAFTSTNGSPVNDVSAAPDFIAPTVSRSVIAKAEGGTPGFIRQGGQYRVYAEATDAGNPASGVAAVSADASSITTGATATALAQGAFSIGGLSYGHRSGLVTANGSLPAGSRSYSLSLTDNAGNSRVQGGFTVTVDNTAPSAADIKTADNAGTVGRAQQGDAITYTFSEPVEPESILSGWDGSATPVVVRLINGLILLGNDGVRIYNSSDSSQLPLGQVDLGRGDYVGGLLGGEIARFGASGTASQMAMSGNSVTITLGSHSGQGVTTAGSLLTEPMVWRPQTAPIDRAGSPMSSASRQESGGNHRQF